jgi:anti-sigma factor RsiW
MTDKWTDKLSEYLDGELPRAQSEALEAHLLECVDCGNALQQLRAVVFRAGQVIDRPPENDLWAGIAARIAEPVPSVAEQPKKRISFSIPQLAAASIVMLLLGSGTMYLMISRGAAPATVASNQPAPRTDAPAAVQLAAATPAPSAAPITTKDLVAHPVAVKSPAEKNYSAAIAELEGALRSDTQLDTATVRVLRNNLRVIDNAIAEARSALGGDPGNPYLNRYLDETMQRKIQLLRRATGIMRAST